MWHHVGIDLISTLLLPCDVSGTVFPLVALGSHTWGRHAIERPRLPVQVCLWLCRRLQ